MATTTRLGLAKPLYGTNTPDGNVGGESTAASNLDLIDAAIAALQDGVLPAGGVILAAAGDQTITGGHKLSNSGGFYGPLVGGQQDAVVALLVDGAIPIVSGAYFVTKGSAGAFTLPTPTVTTHDGVRIRLVSTTAFAHAVTCPSNKINGSKAVATLVAAVGEEVTFEAYQGIWYVSPHNASVVLS